LYFRLFALSQNVINALVRKKGRLHGARTVAIFFNAAILSLVWEWSGSGTNTWLRTRTTPELDLIPLTRSILGSGHPKHYYCTCDSQ